MKKVKRICVFALAAMIMVLLVIVVNVAAYESSASVAIENPQHTPNLQVLTLKYEPYPVNPGEYFDLWLKIGNEEDAEITDLTFELIPEFPFSIDKSETATRYFGKIPANTIVLVHYRIRVSEDAVTGVNPVKFRYRYVQSNLKWIGSQEDILVQTREAVLNIESVVSEPQMIAPGKSAYVTINLKNLGSSAIRDVLFKLDLAMSTVAKNPTTLVPTAVVVDSYFNAVPLVPVNSSTEKMIGYIKGNEEKSVTYILKAYPDAASKVYKVPVRITYQDTIGRNYTKDDVVGLVVGDVPDLSAYISEDTIYSAGAAGDITIKFVNKGTTDIKFLNVMLKKTESYDIISADKVYIGDLDSDDYETADFELNVKRLKDNKLAVPVHIEYKDANNVDYAKNISLEFIAYSMKERGMSTSNSFTKLVVVLVILAAAWLVYRRWEKNKKAKKKER